MTIRQRRDVGIKKTRLEEKKNEREERRVRTHNSSISGVHPLSFNPGTSLGLITRD
jgi:hypothetical protein